MNIQEATKLSLATGLGIVRVAWPHEQGWSWYIKPTNLRDVGLLKVIRQRGEHRAYAKHDLLADDLLADDWLLYNPDTTMWPVGLVDGLAREALQKMPKRHGTAAIGLGDGSSSFPTEQPL